MSVSSSLQALSVARYQALHVHSESLNLGKRRFRQRSRCADAWCMLHSCFIHHPNVRQSSALHSLSSHYYHTRHKTYARAVVDFATAAHARDLGAVGAAVAARLGALQRHEQVVIVVVVVVVVVVARHAVGCAVVRSRQERLTGVVYASDKGRRGFGGRKSRGSARSSLETDCGRGRVSAASE